MDPVVAAVPHHVRSITLGAPLRRAVGEDARVVGVVDDVVATKLRSALLISIPSPARRGALCCVHQVPSTGCLIRHSLLLPPRYIPSPVVGVVVVAEDLGPRSRPAVGADGHVPVSFTSQPRGHEADVDDHADRSSRPNLDAWNVTSEPCKSRRLIGAGTASEASALLART